MQLCVPRCHQRHNQCHSNPHSPSNTGLWLLTHLDTICEETVYVVLLLTRTPAVFAAQHRGLTLTVAVTVSPAMTYPMSSTSPTEHSVLGTTPCPDRQRLSLVFATWMSRVSKNCPEGAWVSPSAEGTPTPPADPSQRAIPELRQGTKVFPFGNLEVCVTHLSQLSSFPPLLFYLLLTHFSSLGQKEMMRGLFSPGSSVPTALTNRKGPLGFRTENLS